MTPFEFVADLEFYSESKFDASARAGLVKACQRLLHIEDEALRDAMRIAKKHRNFDLDFIQSIAAQLARRSQEENLEAPLERRSWSTSLSGLSGLSVADSSDLREPRQRRRRL